MSSAGTIALVVSPSPRKQHKRLMQADSMCVNCSCCGLVCRYLHQTEMNMFFPDMLNMTQAPAWMPDSVWCGFCVSA